MGQLKQIVGFLIKGMAYSIKTPAQRNQFFFRDDARAVGRLEVDGVGHLNCDRLTGRAADADYLRDIAQNIQGRTICAFGEAAAWPVLSFVKKFRDEFTARGQADEAARAKGLAKPGSHH